MIKLAFDKNLENALQEKNVSHIRNALSGIMMKDKGFKTNEFDDSLKYAKSFNVDGLFDKYDG